MHVCNKTIDTCTATDSDVFYSTASSCVFTSMDTKIYYRKGGKDKSQSVLLKQQSKNNNY